MFALWLEVIFVCPFRVVVHKRAMDSDVSCFDLLECAVILLVNVGRF